MRVPIQNSADFVAAKEGEWGGQANIVFYLAVAPQLVPGIATNLGKLPFVAINDAFGLWSKNHLGMI